jgi:hypothetical protein
VRGGRDRGGCRRGRARGVEGAAGAVVEGELEQALDLALLGEEFLELHHLAALERAGDGVADGAPDVLGAAPFALFELGEVLAGLYAERGRAAHLLVALGEQDDREQAAEEREGQLGVELHVRSPSAGRVRSFLR